MPSGRSFYHRRPGRFAKQREDFQRLIEELKRLALRRGYTRKDIAAELGVSHTCVNQWWFGYTLAARRERIERLRNFLAAH